MTLFCPITQSVCDVYRFNLYIAEAAQPIFYNDVDTTWVCVAQATQLAKA